MRDSDDLDLFVGNFSIDERVRKAAHQDTTSAASER